MAELFKDRTNALPYSAELNSLGTMVKTKPYGYRNVNIQLSVRPVAAIETGKTLELDVVIGGSLIRGGSPEAFYRQARILSEPDDETRWLLFNYRFRGWAKDAMVMTVYIERRSDATDPSEVNLLVRRSTMEFY